nr:MAG TPA: adenine-specific methyltransferase [Caudoviricetes sp.]DAQ97852.1 MAG TPA: adenine-specific methyltransferase [Caudoviricetes sp.]
MKENLKLKSPKSIYATIGASSHSMGERDIDDYYATDPRAMEELLKFEIFHRNVWEPACGGGHLSSVLKEHGYSVRNSDVVDRIGDGGVELLDFIEGDTGVWEGDIITNPPYSFAQEFVEKALSTVVDGSKVAMFLKLTFLEGKKRKGMFAKHPPKRVYVFSSRVSCAKGGDFSSTQSSAVAYAWFIWEKGYSMDTIVRWI